MKKNLCVMRRYQKNANLRKIWMTMKLMMVLFFLAITNLMASEAYSQTTRMTLQLKDATVKEVLNKIEENSEFFFLYNGKLVDVNRKVSVDVNDQKINEILSDMFRETDVYWTVVDRQVVLTNKANQNGFALLGSQQQQKVAGIVTDKNGAPIPGVNVVVTGTTQGTMTDVAGKYSIEIPQGSKSLTFSFIGMESQEISIGTLTQINVTMAESAIGLEEVVVIGYGSAKRKDIVGSVATIRSEEMINPVYSNVTSMLQGKASGVFESNGEIRIRGIGSISNTSAPIYVVDGVIMNSVDGMLNPNDIESIDVQKDAAATSIFGSRASNGVIMITTKIGKSGKSTFNVDITSGVSQFVNDGVMLANTATFLEANDLALINEAKYNNTVAPKYNPYSALSWRGWAGYLNDENGAPRDLSYFTREYAEGIDVRALDFVKKNSTYLDANVSASKGFDSGNLFFSMNSRSENGNLKGDESKKLTARFGINITPIKNLKLGLTTATGYYKKINGANIGGIMDSPPFFPVLDPNNETGYWIPVGGPLPNVLATADRALRDDNQIGLSAIGNFNAEYSIPFVKGLSIKANIGYDFKYNENNHWRSKWMQEGTNASGIAPMMWERKQTNYNILSNAHINYVREFGDHSINVVAGVEEQKYWMNFTDVRAENLAGTFHEIGSPTKTQTFEDRLMDELNLFAYFGRLSYKFKGKYLLEGSLRRDGTSKFNPDKQFGTFPALGAGWIISNESFFNFKDINLLKIRASIGQTGNGDVANNIYTNNYTSGTGYMEKQTSRIANIGNPYAEWETTNNFDIGLDFGLFANRINGSIAYYSKNTTGLLLRVPLPISAGIQNNNIIWQNIGNMTNSGIEFNIDFTALKLNDFTWQVSYNHTTNHNEVTALYPQIDKSGNGIFGGGQSETITRTGEKLATLYIPEFAGIDVQTGVPMIYERDATTFSETGETVRTGNLLPMSTLNATNNKFIQKGQSNLPNWFGGLTNTLKYKNIDFSFMIVYVGGGLSILNSDVRLRQMNEATFGYSLANDIVSASWKKPGDIAKYPELVAGGNYYYNDKLESVDSPTQIYGQETTQDMVKGDYMRLKFISLGYTLPRSVVSKIGLADVRIFAHVNNALTFSKVPKGLDPELGIPGNSLENTFITSQGHVPPTRNYSFGISINF